MGSNRAFVRQYEKTQVGKTGIGKCGAVPGENRMSVRNVVERFFLRIKDHRHIVARYDKSAFCFLNFIILATVIIQV